MNSMGVQIVYASGELNGTFLDSLSLLIESSPRTNFTTTELQTVSNWYLNGGRLLLAAGPENGTSIDLVNTLLHSLHSSLAIERAYLQDPLFNLNASQTASDRVIIPQINHSQGLLLGLTVSIRRLYAFRPIPIIAYTNGAYSKYDQLHTAGTTWLAKTASTARTANITGASLLVYSRGEGAEYPVSAVEEAGNGRLALLGFPLFSSEWGLSNYSAEQPYDNPAFLSNLLRWLCRLQVGIELEGAVPLLRASNQPTVLLYTGSRSLHVDQAESASLFSLLTDMGFNTQRLDSMQSDQLKNASALIIQTPYDLVGSNETEALNTWLRSGNKLLILASMADYTVVGSSPESLSLNGVLSDVGATLRFERGSMLDYEDNIGGNPYLTLASNINQAQGILNLTKNVRSLFLQFGTILAGWQGNATTGKLVPLENQTYLATQTNITWIARSSNNSAVFNLAATPTYPLQAHTQGQKGSYITAALERYRVNDRIVLLGGPIFTNFSLLLNYPTAYGYPVDNLLFIRNLFTTIMNKNETRTSIDVSATPSEIAQGGSVNLNVHYSSLQISLTNLSETKIPVTSANITASLGGSGPTFQRLMNGTYHATITPTETGTLSWSVSASASNYQAESAKGTVKVNPLPATFTYYVLTIPIVLFIAVAVVVTARKTR